MRAVLMHGRGDFRVGEVERPNLSGPDQALVRVTLSAICGSDLHIYHGHSPVNEGAVLGHEFVGVVEAVGAEVGRIATGDRVVAAFFAACGRCRLCRRGWWAQCVERAIFGHGELFGDLGGGQAEYCVVPNADLNLALIPAEVADEQAFFVGDILSTGYFAAERGLITPGDTVAVIGAGPVGLMAVMCAQLFGPARVYCVDMVEERLRLAGELGATPIDSRKTSPQAVIQAATEGAGADAVLECVGHMQAIETAFNCCRGGGTVSSVGVPNKTTADFPYLEAWTRDLTFRSGCANVHAYMPQLLELIAAGRLQPERIISHRMKLEEATEAYRLFDKREATKIVLTP
ncbi:MAG: alcohol dehydrogenase catalytic domain-containing protein [Candidatus Dormibacteraeota bacterium]|uniref:Alcohol dehydrogenase catalytic domain-containing protein n=1 Tax=Candidatus Dormiibacter inghamiae TaxID=3127013 RepID=A0A934NDR8_9BACT|nr:alcohol dehydrogenase catalytic domain-containing protein [Candidatus Dormibacteraeota bacterium]MBJ7606729.1 alcohol dehydrogenase catalytic domain-containing protein [Candidatus Dormibacteraeota bacterium]